MYNPLRLYSLVSLVYRLQNSLLNKMWKKMKRPLTYKQGLEMLLESANNKNKGLKLTTFKKL